MPRTSHRFTIEASRFSLAALAVLAQRQRSRTGAWIRKTALAVSHEVLEQGLHLDPLPPPAKVAVTLPPLEHAALAVAALDRGVALEELLGELVAEGTIAALLDRRHRREVEAAWAGEGLR